MLAQAAVHMYQLAKPADMPPPQAYLDLALSFGIYEQGPVNFALAQELAQAGKQDGSVQIARALANRAPGDARIQTTAARFVYGLQGYDAGVQQYQAALASVPEPETRSVRLDYLSHLGEDANYQRQPKAAQDLLAMSGGKDTLLAGEALLVRAQYSPAATQFQRLLDDGQFALPSRLDAWSGLLDSDPPAALARAAGLLDDILAQPAESKARYLSWFGWQLWHAVARDIPARTTFRLSWHAPFRALRDTPTWPATIAPLLQRIFESDPPLCLRPDLNQPSPNSLRVPIALVLAMNAQPQQAITVLLRQIDYDIPPPPGGWKTFDGSPAKAADKPHAAVTPRDGLDRTGQVMALLDALSRSEHAADATPPLAAALANELLTRLKANPSAQEQTDLLHALAAVIHYTAVALDPLTPNLRLDQPPPPTRAVDMPRFAPVAAAVRDALTLDAVAKEPKILLHEGLGPALQTASNAQLLEALFALLTTVLDRYRATGAAAKDVALQATHIAAPLYSREVYDLTPYARRLQERYPMP
jgi:hypothetical protein